MINNVTLIGRLTKNIEIRHIKEDTTACNFNLAVNRNFKNAKGEYDADFVPCQAFNHQASILDQYGSQGTLVGITGRIQTRTYDNNGVKVYVTEVRVEQVNILDKLERRQESPFYEAPNPQPVTPSTFMTPDHNNAPISDDDLPF